MKVHRDTAPAPGRFSCCDQGLCIITALQKMWRHRVHNVGDTRMGEILSPGPQRCIRRADHATTMTAATMWRAGLFRRYDAGSRCGRDPFPHVVHSYEADCFTRGICRSRNVSVASGTESPIELQVRVSDCDSRSRERRFIP